MSDQPSKIMRITGNRVRELRLKSGRNQDVFAEMIGLSRSYLAGVESGKRNVTFNTFNKILCGLGVTWKEFFDTPDFDHCVRNGDEKPTDYYWIERDY